MKSTNTSTLHHLKEVKEGKRRFENAFQAVSRMIFEGGIEKVMVNTRTTYDFTIFRTGRKHPVGMYDEINSFVSFVKDAAEGGSSKEMAFVLVGEPGNGKTFFVEYLCAKYRQFLSQEGNRRYTYRLVGMDRLGSYGKISRHRVPDLRGPDGPRHEPLPRPGRQQEVSCREGRLHRQGDRDPLRQLPSARGLQRLHVGRYPQIYRRGHGGDAQVRGDHPGPPHREPRHGDRQVPGKGQDHLVGRRSPRRGVDPAPAPHHRHQQSVPLRPAPRCARPGGRRRHPLRRRDLQEQEGPGPGLSRGDPEPGDRDGRLQVADRHPDRRHQQQLGVQPLPVGEGGGPDHRPLPDLLRLPQYPLPDAGAAHRLRHRRRDRRPP